MYYSKKIGTKEEVGETVKEVLDVDERVPNETS